MGTLLGSIILGFLNVAGASEPSIAVRAESWIKGSVIHLEDIAEVSGIPSVSWRKIKTISLGEAPGYGESRKFSNTAISEALRDRIRVAGLNGIKLRIPNEAVVYGAGLLITEPMIKGELLKALAQNCPDCRYEIRDIIIPRFQNFPPFTKWELRTDISKLKGGFNVPIEVREPGATAQTHWISGKIAIFREVPIATRTLHFKDRLKPEDFKLSLRDVTFATDTPPGRGELTGAEVGAAVPAGQPIWRSALVREKAVSFGDSVTVITGTEKWKVSLKGVARQNGFIGDRVQVLNPDTKKTVVGEIIEKGVVEVR